MGAASRYRCRQGLGIVGGHQEPPKRRVAQVHDHGGLAAVQRREVLAAAIAPRAQRDPTGNAGSRSANATQLAERPPADVQILHGVARDPNVAMKRTELLRPREPQKGPSRRSTR